MLRLLLTRLSPTHHRFQYVRADGTGESTELETRSFLTHDLLHLAVETEAGLHESFFGQLAGGKGYGELTGAPKLTGEILATERVVGVLTGVVQGAASPAAAFVGLTELFSACGDPLPPWLSESFLEKAAERFRRLQGQWKATPFGQTMELSFKSP
jgi:hypothetical protein